MEVIRLQNEIPEIYTSESRDFQLLCRLYDCVINGMKFNIDSAKKVLDTRSIRTNLLPLLQTKVGFFSNSGLDDESLRLLLEAFPSIVKKKGSLNAINEAISVYLKILNIRVPIVVTLSGENQDITQQITLPDHTIIIGLNSTLESTMETFKELLRYILPAGFGFYMYFYNDIHEVITLLEDERVAILYVSDEMSSIIRGNDPAFEGVRSRLDGNVGLAEVVGVDSFDVEMDELELRGLTPEQTTTPKTKKSTRKKK